MVLYLNEEQAPGAYARPQGALSAVDHKGVQACDGTLQELPYQGIVFAMRMRIGHDTVASCLTMVQSKVAFDASESPWVYPPISMGGDSHFHLKILCLGRTRGWGRRTRRCFARWRTARKQTGRRCEDPNRFTPMRRTGTRTMNEGAVE